MPAKSTLRQLLDRMKKPLLVSIAEWYDLDNGGTAKELANRICVNLERDISKLVCATGPWYADHWNDFVEEALGGERRKSYESIVEEIVLRLKGEDEEEDSEESSAPEQYVEPRRKLKSNPRMIIPMIPLAKMSASTIGQLLAHVPEYGPADFRSLVENTIGAIHQVPHIFHEQTSIKYQLKQVEAYFGRSSSGVSDVAQNLYSCWVRGREERGHEYGMVFAKTSIKASLKYERHGILLIEALRQEDGLCISNKTLTARGGVGSIEPGFLYMTFRLLRKTPEPARELTFEEIRDCVRKMKAELSSLAVEMKVPENDIRDAFQHGLVQANNVENRGRFKVINYDAM